MAARAFTSGRIALAALLALQVDHGLQPAQSRLPCWLSGKGWQPRTLLPALSDNPTTAHCCC